MINILKEDNSVYSWLLNQKDIGIEYVKSVVHDYVKKTLGTNIRYNRSNIGRASGKLLPVGNVSELGYYRNILDVPHMQQFVSTKCKYKHILVTNSDSSDYLNNIEVHIDNLNKNIISDSELIRLYNDDDENLIDILAARNSEATD